MKKDEGFMRAACNSIVYIPGTHLRVQGVKGNQKNVTRGGRRYRVTGNGHAISNTAGELNMAVTLDSGVSCLIDIGNDFREHFSALKGGAGNLTPKRVEDIKKSMPVDVGIDIDESGNPTISQADLDAWFAKLK